MLSYVRARGCKGYYICCKNGEMIDVMSSVGGQIIILFPSSSLFYSLDGRWTEMSGFRRMAEERLSYVRMPEPTIRIDKQNTTGRQGAFCRYGKK